MLGPRQTERVGIALAAAEGEIRKRLERNEAVRQDGFFDDDDPEHSPAAQLLEGVLLQAADTPQEKKVPYLGALFASIAFRPDISADYGHLLLRLAERLTYRQMQALALFSENEGAPELTEVDVRRNEEDRWTYADGLGAEMAVLGDMGLSGFRQQDGSVSRPANSWGGGDPQAWQLPKFALTSLGEDLYELMELRRIPPHDKAAILSLIWAGHRPG